MYILDFPGGSVAKNPSASAGDVGSIVFLNITKFKERTITDELITYWTHWQDCILLNEASS